MKKSVTFLSTSIPVAQQVSIPRRAGDYGLEFDWCPFVFVVYFSFIMYFTFINFKLTFSD